MKEMEVEIIDGTVEIDIDEIVNEVINSGRLIDDIEYVVSNRIDYDDIRMNIEYDILSNVHDHIDSDTLFDNVNDYVDFYYNTHQLDFDEIREMIEDDILSSVEMYLDYDSIITQVNQRQIPELTNKIIILENEIETMELVLAKQHDDLMKVLNQNEHIMSQFEELQMSVWSRVVRYVRSWF